MFEWCKILALLSSPRRTDASPLTVARSQPGNQFLDMENQSVVRLDGLKQGLQSMASAKEGIVVPDIVPFCRIFSRDAPSSLRINARVLAKEKQGAQSVSSCVEAKAEDDTAIPGRRARNVPSQGIDISVTCCNKVFDWSGEAASLPQLVTAWLHLTCLCRCP